ncbi:GMC family oxidoreductase [Rivularia sp. UHCC 0363]|uniref:GMC family oxidoreductase n=1 Tax=Rivularia sp. UHCC 0363 TaxID=3110244 RepID=UPI002B214207|nr:GMC family oxidoreductase [Rivularia sp. UHCC 0363]MEA5597023.1 GMC family oxidoreductase [Rivularia sp. UHCC 0363]
MADTNYDVIIIGTGAGGGTLAKVLAASGKKILILERGSFLPKEKANWNTPQISKDGYRTQEIWYDKQGKPIHPATHYNVGGNTKFYGSALFRLRDRDFETIVHHDGISPEWALKYPDFAPYYHRAEQMYEVHGKRGLDLTEPQENSDYPFPPVTHEPYIQEINDKLKNKGLHPFYLPLGLKLNSKKSSCIRCNTCDGFPCLVDGKADSDINGVRPAIANNNVTLITQAKVLKLHTNPSGTEVSKVEVDILGKRHYFSANIVVVSCGAINSAILLLKSANDKHPNGLANSSDLVGRNYMAHKFGVVVALSSKKNNTIFQKTIGLNDFYWGEKDFNYPMGSIQLLGNISEERIAFDAPFFIPRFIAKTITKHIIGWLLITEDLPNYDNRVRVHQDKIFLEYTHNNNVPFRRLMQRWVRVLKSTNTHTDLHDFSLYSCQTSTIKEVAHQCGTCRFGEDAKTSVLDINCRTHDVNNLYVVDGSFFPSSAAVNPTLTIIANAIRVGEHILDRLK